MAKSSDNLSRVKNIPENGDRCDDHIIYVFGDFEAKYTLASGNNSMEQMRTTKFTRHGSEERTHEFQDMDNSSAAGTESVGDVASSDNVSACTLNVKSSCEKSQATELDEKALDPDDLKLKCILSDDLQRGELQSFEIFLAYRLELLWDKEYDISLNGQGVPIVRL